MGVHYTPRLQWSHFIVCLHENVVQSGSSAQAGGKTREPNLTKKLCSIMHLQ